MPERTSAAEASSGGASTAGEMKRSLTLTGVTMNAMALIAPGAFLWTTFQMQSSQVSGGAMTAPDMWTGLVFALVLAFFTAYSYAELARIFPDAGTGSSYYFAEAALLDKEKPAEIMRLVEQTDDLPKNLSAAAHLIHGSSEDRFTVTYAQSGLSRDELLQGLSQQLPEVINHLTPDGRLPTESELSGRL